MDFTSNHISSLMAKEVSYEPVDTDSDHFNAVHSRTSPSKRFLGWWQVIAPFAWIFTTTLYLILIVSLLKVHYFDKPSKVRCWKELSTYSPALEAVEYEAIQFQNSFFEPSIYRGKPTPERNEAWRVLWDVGGINVPYVHLDLLNMSKEVPWQRTEPQYGGGVMGYLEVFHTIHCLDMLRQYTYKDQYEFHNVMFDAPAHLVREHMDHCINTLRISLQCTSDVTPYLNFVDPKKPEGLDASFNTLHQCRNFEKIRQWTIAHSAEPNHH